MKSKARILKYALATLAIAILLLCAFFGYRDIPVDVLKEKYAPAPSAFAEVAGMQVHYRDEGDPTDSLPIVLIHGTGASLHTFEAWASQLKQQHRVVRLDMPGFGLTGPFPNRDYSMKQYADFLAEFLSTRGVRTCILGGNSLGGRIAWNFALRYPEMADQLILIDASGYPLGSKSVPLAFRLAKTPVINKLLTFITPRFMAKASIANVYVDKSKVTDELVDRYFTLTLRAGNRQSLVDRINTKPDSTAHHKIKDIKQRTLLLWGEQDYLIPVSHARQFQQDLPNDTLVILKNVGHVPMEEVPEESLAVVRGFLNEEKR